jgi:hypothetical protein
MTRNAEPIQDHALRHKVDPNISHTQRFLEFEACVEAGLDLERWETFGYNTDFKASVIAWYILRGLKKVHTEDAMNRKLEAERKRRK